MNDKEAIKMMQRCKHEIMGLREEVKRLRPKADAYDSVAQILALLPRPNECVSEDMVWLLDKRINEFEVQAQRVEVPAEKAQTDGEKDAA